MSPDAYPAPEKLLSEVTRGIGDEQTLVASRLLSQHDDAFWLRQFLQPEDSDTRRRYARVTEIPDVTRTSTLHDGLLQHLRWDQIGDLLREGLPTSRSETAILAVAASLVGEYDINLRDALASLDHDQARLVIAAITDAAP